MTTFLKDEIGRVPGESVIPTDTAAILAANPAWTLTGDVWETVTTEDVTVLGWGTPAPITPRMGCVLTIDVHASTDAQLRWLIHQTYYDGGTLTLADGAANIDPTTPVPAGAWVATARAWDAPEGIVSGSFVTEVTAPVGTTIQLRAPFAAPLDGPLVVRQVVAGNPNGARVVLAGDALTAYDSTGTETARITGEGGEFVGGEFRTSDTLPGQVTLSDTAAAGGPGIEITPVNATGYASFPHISPSFGGVNVHGGESLAGNSSAVYANPAKAGVLTLGSDGAQSEISASPAVVSMSRTLTDGTGGEVELLPGIIRLSYRFGGDTKTLAIDTTGVWVRTGGKSYNLEQTATMPAPELLPYAVSTGWDTQHSPLGSVLVTHSTTGRHCQSRVRFNRRGTDFPLTTTNTSIGQVIPSGARHSISMVDYIPVTLPGGIAGELVADYRYGHVYLHTLTGTAVMRDGDYVYATLSWFIPN